MRIYILLAVLLSESAFGCQALSRAPIEDLISLEERGSEGDISAQRQLGYIFASGNGAPQDFVKSSNWYRKAAENGDAISQVRLGLEYSFGHGVPQNDSVATQWYHRAAAHGSVEAYRELGFSYALGKGVAQDLVKAYKWWALGQKKGDEESIRLLKELTAQMSAEQIADAEHLITEWEENSNATSREREGLSSITQPSNLK